MKYRCAYVKEGINTENKIKVHQTRKQQTKEKSNNPDLYNEDEVQAEEAQ